MRHVLHISLCIFLLTGCAFNLNCGRSGDQEESSQTIFFILGFLDEYHGRRIEEKGDFVEHFYCNEQEEALLFEKFLYKLKSEKGID